MRIFSIDQSLVNSGWCLLEDGKTIAIGSIKPKTKGVQRLLDIRTELNKIYHDNQMLEKKIDMVVMEGYSFGSRGMAVFNLGELGGLVRVWCVDTFAQDPIVVAPTTLKKFVTGHGNGDKDVMLKGVFQKWGFDTNDHNIADAFALAQLGNYVLKYQQGTREFAKYELECIERVLKIEEEVE